MSNMLPHLLLFTKSFKNVESQVSNYLDIPGWKEALIPVDGPIPARLILHVFCFVGAYLVIRTIITIRSYKNSDRS